MTLLSDKTPLTNMRRKEPLVQCITNFVAMNFAANVLTSIGASPAMTMAPEEMADFVRVADALTVNTGTITSQKLLASQLAMSTAKESATPTVLDPVAHFATPFRKHAAQLLIKLSPTILRANSSEILAFKGFGSGKGVDSKNTPEEAFETAVELANEWNCIVAVSGKTDFVTDGKRHLTITGGHDLMPKVSAMGCALTCLMGAFAASHVNDPFSAAAYAFMAFSVAGSKAGKNADGPGSFAVRFLDELAHLNDEDLFHNCQIANGSK